MSETLELSREEITRLSRMDDIYGHAWALYLLLKKHMDVYTGLVYVDKKFLSQVTATELHLQGKHEDHEGYLVDLINSLTDAEVVSNCSLNNDIVFIKLPIAYSEFCFENYSRH